MANPDVHIPPETYVVGDVINSYLSARTLPWPDLTRLVLSAFEYHPDFELFAVESLRPLVLQVQELPEGQRCLAEILDAFYRFHAAETGRPGVRTWGDKTPWNTFFLREIDSVFPAAKYVHLLRDGVDVVASMLSAGRYNDEVDAAWRWRSAVEAVERATRNPNRARRTLTVRYEVLVSAPNQAVAKLCEFLGLTQQTGMLSEVAAAELRDVQHYEHLEKVRLPISDEWVDGGRNTLDTNALRRVAPILDPVLKRYGYASTFPHRTQS